MLEDRPWLIAFLDRGEAIAVCATVMAVGVAIDFLPAKRLAAALSIVSTLLVDAVLLGMQSSSLRIWEVLALVVVAAALASFAGLVSADGPREKLAMRILVAVGMSAVLLLAGVVIVVVDEPWF
jgi:hypothetical protein